MATHQAVGYQYPSSVPAHHAEIHVRFSPLAIAREPEIESKRSSLVRAVSEVAGQLKVPVTKLVVRGDCSVESDDAIYQGLILDVYTRNEDEDVARQLWERLVQRVDPLVSSQLSVLLHGA